jgi:hypothetical protein
MLVGAPEVADEDTVGLVDKPDDNGDQDVVI